MATRKRGHAGRGRKRERPSPRTRANAVRRDDRSAPFPIVAVGASAGGLEAFTELLENLPADPNAAVVYIAHLDPKGASALPQILSRETSMPVVDVKDGTVVERNNLYVMPPRVEMTIESGVLRLQRAVDARPHMPIDAFLHSLAEDQGSRAIAVILSGTASDGALGTCEVKNAGGVTFAQDDSAKFDGMPHSAIAAGSIDFVLPPREIAKKLLRISHHSYMTGPAEASSRLPQSDLTRIYALLQSVHEIDFTHYKPSTLERRIRRRMAMNKVHSLGEYLKVLRNNPVELEQLYGDILIRVTGFFRDPEVFEALRKDIVPGILESRSDAVRIWVPGCATGEEVYSLAILLLEAAADAGVTDPAIQLFGTDVSDAAIGHARAGLYPENIAANVSPERLRRFFTKVDGNYRVAKTVRDCCIFAKQNMTQDPPFSKIDLISCRNVLIYFGAVLQRKVMAIFHFALRPKGYLLLGGSETVGNFGELFTLVDRRHRIYRKKGADARMPLDFDPAPPVAETRQRTQRPDPGSISNVFREADRIALSRYAPAGVLISETGDIIQFRGRTSAFLEPAPGAANFNILKMAREGLLGELRTAIHSARKSDTPVRREGIRVSIDDDHTILANIEVLPFTTIGKERFQLVIFEEVPDSETKAKGRKKKGAKSRSVDAREVVDLKRELEATRDYLQSIIEEQEAMNEEMRSANEEIQSSNEELQSTNEELETAKEELQSSNEELMTLNEELDTRYRELALANDDMVNILASIDLPVVMLDQSLRIRRFNPGAQKALGILPSDIGRSIDDLNTKLQITDLHERVMNVIDTLTTHEAAVPDREGRSYVLRIRPYRTGDNRIEGAVMLLIEADTLKRVLAS